MAQRETEFKYLLDSSERDRLRAGLGEPISRLEFVNRYYTLTGERQRKDWVLRTRRDAEGTVLTLKIGREVSPGVFDSMEYSAKVTGDPLSWEGTEPMKMFRQEISGEPVGLQGEMANLREIYRPPVEVGRVWEMDLAVLPNGEQFSELEVEVVAEGDRLSALRGVLEDWLKKTGIEPRPSTKTKYARFLEALSPS